MKSIQPLVRKSDRWFKESAYLVSYDIDLSDPLIRIFVIDFIPGKFLRFFGIKIKRRTFKGNGKKWWETTSGRSIVIHNTSFLGQMLLVNLEKQELSFKIKQKVARQKKYFERKKDIIY